MEFVDGTDLARIIQEREPLSLEAKVGHVIGLLNGLAYAHTKGVVHRDIKPANVRITGDGRVKIMDFGIAHLAGSEMTHSGVVLGTPDYMAPEQVRGLPVTPQTDIFAAGAVLYELLTYEKPFGGETLHAVLFKVVTEDPVPITRLNPSLPEALERITNTALHKDPGKRYPTAEAMAVDLGSVRKHLSELETKATLRFSRPLLATDLLPWYRRRPAMVFGGGIGGLAAVVMVAVLASGGEPPRDLTAREIVVNDTVSAPAQVVAQPLPDTIRPAPAATRTTASASPASRPPARRPPPPTPAATQPQPAPTPRVEVQTAVAQLEDAFESRRASNLRALFPTMPDSIVRQWETFFRGKTQLDTEIDMNNLRVEGDIARARLEITFRYKDSSGRDRETKLPTMNGSLQRSGAEWVWKTLGG
jgi:serine/threonine-protein kinase